jgi:hypothetical protein
MPCCSTPAGQFKNQYQTECMCVFFSLPCCLPLSCVLQITLEPVSLRLAALNAAQYHADLTELIKKGIRQEQSHHIPCIVLIVC